MSYEKSPKVIGVFSSCTLLRKSFVSKRARDQEKAEFGARHYYLLTVIKASDSLSSVNNKQSTEFYLTEKDGLSGNIVQYLSRGKVLVIKNANYTDASVGQDYQNIFATVPSRSLEMRKLGFKIILFTDGKREWKYTL